MKVLILHKWLVMGGIEKILINYLNLLKTESSIHIELLIAFDTPQSILSSDIPENINIHYIFDKKYYQSQQSLYQNRHNNLFQRIKYKLFRIKEKKQCNITLHKMIKHYDIVINFSNHFDPYLNFNKINIPIIRWQHSALDSIDSKLIQREIDYLRKYDKVIAICKEMEKDIQIKSGISNQHLDYIYNPINFENVKKLSIQKANNIKEPYLIQVARLEKSKNHIALIEIYSELVKKGIPHQLYIIGDGPEYDILTQKIQELKLENRCILLGEIHNPYPYIKNAELFLHTSKKEGLPTVLLESAILETLIVAMDCPTGTKEILNNGKCGVLIPLDNKVEFIDKTYELLNNLVIQEVYKINMKNHLNTFSEKKIKEKLLKLLNLLSQVKNNIPHNGK